MPQVGGGKGMPPKEFSYTPKGEAAAERYGQKTGGKVTQKPPKGFRKKASRGK